MNPEAIQQLVPEWRVRHVAETASTSDLVREAGLRGEESGLVIFADSQTAGRGQRSNRWLAPAGKDLMFSVLLRPSVPVECWPRLTTLAALAVCRAVEQMLPLRFGIKWPNDIYLGGRKVCGLLAETFGNNGEAFIVLGIGLNVNNTSFPEELQGTATSLLRELPATVAEVPREALATLLLRELSAVLTLWHEDYHEAIAQVRDRSILIGKNIRAVVNDTVIHGRVLDLNHEGHLTLRLADGGSLTLSSAAEVRADG